jgi:hypothetical protein
MRPLSHQRYDRLQAKARLLGPTGRGTSGFGTLLPGANAAVCQQLSHTQGPCLRSFPPSRRVRLPQGVEQRSVPAR